MLNLRQTFSTNPKIPEFWKERDIRGVEGRKPEKFAVWRTQIVRRNGVPAPSTIRSLAIPLFTLNFHLPSLFSPPSFYIFPLIMDSLPEYRTRNK